MFKIVSKKFLNNNVFEIIVHAPLVAKNAMAGEFIILRVNKNGERVPFTIADADKINGNIKIIVQIVGATTKLLSLKNSGDYITDFVGPLGNPTDTQNVKKVCVIGGGLGSAIAMPIAKDLKNKKAEVITIIGFKNKQQVILEKEFKQISNRLIITTDDGSYGEHGNVTVPLENMLKNGEKFDRIYAMGPLVMMKYVSLCTKKYNIPLTVSMNPIMIDGTGMCGGCRVTTNNNGKKEIKFACIDGPDFDGYSIDYDELILRNNMYRDIERHRYEKTCNLLKKAEEK